MARPSGGLIRCGRRQAPTRRLQRRVRPRRPRPRRWSYGCLDRTSATADTGERPGRRSVSGRGTPPRTSCRSGWSRYAATRTLCRKPSASSSSRDRVHDAHGRQLPQKTSASRIGALQFVQLCIMSPLSVGRDDAIMTLIGPASPGEWMRNNEYSSFGGELSIAKEGRIESTFSRSDRRSNWSLIHGVEAEGDAASSRCRLT
jgi:hypothetical protein